MGLPTIKENPKGLHARYHIQKYVGEKIIGGDFFGKPIKEPIFQEVDPDAEYFVLRLDKKGKDPKHIAACRKAILVYAEEISSHIPELALDLAKKYGG